MDSSAQIKVAAPAKRGRIPALVNTAITLALVLILTTLTLRALQSPPPEVAEFAPQVEQQIKEALGSQGGEIGGSEGGTGAGAAPPPVEQRVPSNLVKRCVGNPPRQIEDSQSPPCIAYWEGNNGGATAPGVTRDSIYVAIWTQQSPAETVREFEAFRNFFNDRFQFYGRNLVFEYCTGANAGDGFAQAADAYGGCTSSADPQASANGMPSGHVPFAAPGFGPLAGQFNYDKTLACNHHVIAVSTYTMSDTYMREPPNCFPYFWQYAMANENENTMTGQWICARFAGQVARFAAGTDGKTPPNQLNELPRKFGLVVGDAGQGQGDPTSTPAVYGRVLSELKACGIEIAQQDIMAQSGAAPDSATYTSALVQMKQDGVTSIICLAVFGNCYGGQNYAGRIPYFPEWLADTFSGLDTNALIKILPADQRVRLMVLSFLPKQVRPALDPWYQAINSVDPSNQLPGDSTSVVRLRIQYWSLLLLASGIQMAGPNLTPQRFANALWRTTFPNPATPLYEGKVGFAGQSLEMTTDAAEIWVSNTAAGPYSDTGAGTGVACYIDHGARQSAGKWQKGSDAAYFNDACDSGG